MSYGREKEEYESEDSMYIITYISYLLNKIMNRNLSYRYSKYLFVIIAI